MMDEENQADAWLRKQGGKAAKGCCVWALGLLVPAAPFLLIVICVGLLGTGLYSAFSTVGSFLKGLFGSSDASTEENMAMLDNLTLEEVLELVKGDKLDKSFYETMMINKEEFQYLLERVQEVNNQSVEREIEIQCKHVYEEWVADKANPNGGHWETRTEYPYRSVTVNSDDIEKYKLDWQLVYSLCLTNTMSGVSGWTRVNATEEYKGDLEHYGADHEVIDSIIDNVQMNYEYVTDLARSSQSSYTMDECEAMVHTSYQYGSADSEGGEWTYYIPHSVLKRAYSGYSCMYYLLSEDRTHLEKLITASDMKHFDLIVKRFCKKYNFSYFSSILSFIPGGGELAGKLSLYYDNRENGMEIASWNLTDYEIGSGISIDKLPTSTEPLTTDFGDLTDYGDLKYYGDIEFDDGIGGSIVADALTRVGSSYDQGNRWSANAYDCSSFVYRVLQSVDPSMVRMLIDTTAAGECKSMVEAGMTINPADIQQGDIIFYANGSGNRYRGVTHTAIYAGDGKIVHARGKAYGVCVSNYYTKGLVCVCRPYKKQLSSGGNGLDLIPSFGKENGNG